MNVQCPAPAGYETTVPGKIEAALRFLQHAYLIENGPPHMDAHREGGRKLSGQEHRAYDAALACLTEFFNSDDMGGPTPPPPPPDDPKEKVPVS